VRLAGSAGKQIIRRPSIANDIMAVEAMKSKPGIGPKYEKSYGTSVTIESDGVTISGRGASACSSEAANDSRRVINSSG